MRRTAILAVLAAAALAVHLLFLFHSPYVYDEEEYKTGSIAALVMAGPKLPILEYQPGDYEGGTLLYGLLTIPFFAILGKSFLGLKALALSTALLLALSQAAWAYKIGGERTAILAGALAVLPVPYIVQVTSLPWGNYAETAAWTAFVFLIFHGFIFEKRRTAPRAIALGFLWGFGTWMHYGFLVTPLVCLFIWHLVDKRFFRNRLLYISLAAAAVGFAPWWAYNLTHHFWGLYRFGDALAGGEGASRIAAVPLRLVSLLSNDFAAGMHFRFGRPVLDRAVSYTYEIALLGLGVAFVVLVRRKLAGWLRALSPKPSRKAEADRDLAAATPLIYAAAFSAVYSFTGYGLFKATWEGLDPETHAHIFQLYPMLSLAAAVTLGRIWDARRAAAAGAFVFLIAAGFAGNLSLVNFHRSQIDRLSAPAYDMGVIYMEIGSKWAREHEELNPLIERVPDEAKRSMAFGAGISYGLFHIGKVNAALDKCAALPERFQPYCRLGIGCGLMSSNEPDETSIENEVRALPGAAAATIEAGMAIGHIWFGRMDHPAIAQAWTAPLPSILPDEEREPFRLFLEGQLSMAKTVPRKD